jgi:predicted amino acid-binding ACT domain protein
MNMNFTDKKVSVRRSITILAKNGVEVDDDEANVIMDFFYLMAKNHTKEKVEKMSKPKGEIEL